MTSETLYQRSANAIVADLDGDVVMMDVDQGSYFAINPVGSHIWTQLETPKSQSQLVVDVQKAFQAADPAQVTEDVSKFMAALLEHKLINPVTA